VFGLGGIVFQFVPQMAHGYAHVMSIFGMRRTPYFSQNLPVGQHLACIGDHGNFYSGPVRIFAKCLERGIDLGARHIQMRNEASAWCD